MVVGKSSAGEFLLLLKIKRPLVKNVCFVVIHGPDFFWARNILIFIFATQNNVWRSASPKFRGRKYDFQVLYVAGGATQNTIRVAQWMLQDDVRLFGIWLSGHTSPWCILVPFFHECVKGETSRFVTSELIMVGRVLVYIEGP